jgi:hypothetical protein
MQFLFGLICGALLALAFLICIAVEVDKNKK